MNRGRLTGLLFSITALIGTNSAYAWRTEENSDTIDDLRETAREYSQDKWSAMGDYIRDLVTGDWASAAVDGARALEAGKHAEEFSREADFMEYCPDGYRVDDAHPYGYYKDND